MNDQIPFQLLAWIKKNQEEILQHKTKMAIKNYEEDKKFLQYIKDILSFWGILKTKEKIMLLSFVRQHKELRNLTTGQRSVASALYLKYYLNKDKNI